MSDLELFKQILERQQTILDRINDTVYGNGHEGLVTKAQKNAQAIQLLIWLTGAVAVILIGIGMNDAANAIRHNFSHPSAFSVPLEREAHRVGERG